MKKLLFFLALLFVPTARAQSLLIGPDGGFAFSNGFGGLTLKVELPVHHLELDITNQFDPLESHIKLGSGYAEKATLAPILWVKPSLGLQGALVYSGYSVTATAKHAYYVQGNLVYRTLAIGVPTRFTFGYIREVNNGILVNGDETGHLQGGQVIFDTRIGCVKPFCVRIVTQISAGRVLNQGNPLCDGTRGAVTCPRSAALSGGTEVSVLFEFPHRRGKEQDLF